MVQESIKDGDRAPGNLSELLVSGRLFGFGTSNLQLCFGQLYLGAGGLYWRRFTCANTTIDDAETALSQFERLLGQVETCLGPQRGVKGLDDICTQAVNATV